MGAAQAEAPRARSRPGAHRTRTACVVRPGSRGPCAQPAAAAAGATAPVLHVRRVAGGHLAAASTGRASASHPVGGASVAEPAAIPVALAAAARASLDASEMQDVRGSKRDALARTLPRPAAPPTRPPPADPPRGARRCVRRRLPSRRRTAATHRRRHLSHFRPLNRQPLPAPRLRPAPRRAYRPPTLPVAVPPRPHRHHWRPSHRCTPPAASDGHSAYPPTSHTSPAANHTAPHRQRRPTAYRLNRKGLCVSNS